MFSTGVNGRYVNIYSAKETAEHIFDTITYYEEENKRLREKNKELRDNAEAIVHKEYEEKISRLEKKLQLSYGSFASQKELDAYNNFTNKHMHNRLTNKYNGGRAPYLIPTATGIGTDLRVVCPICGEAEDITDTGVW